MTSPRFRLAATTADTGLLAWGASPEELFENAALGLGALMADPRGVRALERRAVEARGFDAGALLVAWLNEWVYLFDTEAFLLREARVTAIEKGLVRGEGRGERYDPSRHRLRDAVKAVTYHRLEIREAGGRLRARLVVDL